MNSSEEVPKNGRGSNTTKEQLNYILEWLEVESNFKLITGGSKSSQVIDL